MQKSNTKDEKSVHGRADASVSYVTALSVDDAEGLTDKEKISLVLLATSQLAAYLEGQLGLGGQGDGGVHIQTAPNINMNIGGDHEKALEMLRAAMQPTKSE